jgi:hypothetical protein
VNGEEWRVHAGDMFRCSTNAIEFIVNIVANRGGPGHSILAVKMLMNSEVRAMGVVNGMNDPHSLYDEELNELHLFAVRGVHQLPITSEILREKLYYTYWPDDNPHRCLMVFLSFRI